MDMDVDVELRKEMLAFLLLFIFNLLIEGIEYHRLE